MPRAALLALVEDALRITQKAESDAARNQIGLFGKRGDTPVLALRETGRGVAQKEILKFEKETLGFYITAHPLDKYERELRRVSAS